jgi:hypothetical protein
MARTRWPLAYKGTAAEPKIVNFTPSPTSGTETGAPRTAPRGPPHTTAHRSPVPSW